MSETLIPSPIVRPGYRLADSLWATGGSVILTGTQALVRLLLMQRQRLPSHLPDSP